MIGKPPPAVRGTLLALAAGFLAAGWSVTPANAQTPPTTVPAVATSTGSSGANVVPATGFASQGIPVDSIVPVGCASCSGMGGTMAGPVGGCSSCGGGGGDGGCPSCCYAGKKPCDCYFGDGPIGRCLNGIYGCVCCPDPCYESCWLPVANAAFFADSVRPVTQMRFRYDAGLNITDLDRGEFLFPRFNVKPNAVSSGGQAGPVNPGAPSNIPGKGPSYIAGKSTYEDLSLYTEGAIGNFGLFMEMFYRDLDPRTAPDSPSLAPVSAGFGDMVIGTKSLLLDCELINLAFQFKTFIPTGNFTKGLGTGHVSLEPALLWYVKCTDTKYIQFETAYWIPIGGDQLYESNVWHNHLSFNCVLCKPCCTTMLIGTFEMNNYTFFQGAFTSPNIVIGGVAPAAISATTGMFSAGPGLRMVICNYIDFGVGTAFSLTGDHLAQQLIRTELRWRF
jgi:hypothetical protein